MTSQINADLYNKLLHYYNANQIKGVQFYPHHKGLEVSVDGSLNNTKEQKSLESDLAEWWYANDFREESYMSLTINYEEVLCFQYDFSVNWMKWGTEAGVSDLCNEKDIAPHLELEEEDFDLDRVLLTYSLTYEESGPDVYSYSLYYDSEEQGEIDLSESQEIQKAIIVSGVQWATHNAQYRSYANYSFSMEVEDSRLHSFTESASMGLIELEPVEE